MYELPLLSVVLTVIEIEGTAKGTGGQGEIFIIPRGAMHTALTLVAQWGLFTFYPFFCGPGGSMEEPYARHLHSSHSRLVYTFIFEV